MAPDSATDKKPDFPRELIDAGVLKLFEYDPDFDNEREIVEAILALGVAYREG